MKKIKISFEDKYLISQFMDHFPLVSLLRGNRLFCQFVFKVLSCGCGSRRSGNIEIIKFWWEVERVKWVAITHY